MGNKESIFDDYKPEYSQPSSSTETTFDHKHAHKFSTIKDQYKSLDEVISALRESGLESSNLILGIDFTKSNEWTGKHSFQRRSLHAIGDFLNPYEQAISIIGRTLSPFDEDSLIPCFGFGDASTHDQNVFSFFPDHRPCHGFQEALARYREILPHVRLAGPTSFAPIIDAAMGIVERSGGQYHVLVIVADGQVTRSSDIEDGQLSPQEKRTVDSIVAASQYPLSIILVGVGDGPWDAMQQFDDNIPRRNFDNFQFVNFTKVMSKNASEMEKEAAFALAALMEIPSQYKAVQELGLLGRCAGKAPEIVALPPPVPIIGSESSAQMHAHSVMFRNEPSTNVPNTSFHANEYSQNPCPICLSNPRDMAFSCGHTTCRECGDNLSTCPLCRAPITTRIKLYSA